MIEKAQPKFKLNKFGLFRDLGYEPHPGQVAVHKSEAPRRVLACGVRWGKSLCCAAEGLAAAMQPCSRSMGWVVAPTYELADKVYREIVILVAEHLPHRIITLRESDRRLVVRNLGGGVSEIRAKSADNPTSLLGEGLDWLIVDEAARLKPLIWQSHLSQRLIDKKGWALLISTPKGKGWLYDLFMRGKRGDSAYESWNCPSWDNPHLDRQLIEAERELLPERVFQQEFGGKFLEGAGAVFRKVRECATGTWQEPKSGESYVAGLDLAKVEDFTVIVVMNRAREVVFMDRFNRLDWSLQVNRIHAAGERFNRARILCDSTGAGEPVFESLQKAGCAVDPYSFTQKSKSALIDNLSLMLEQEKIILPRPDLCPELIDELEAFEYSISDAGNVKTSAPHGIHDDCVVALALAAWKARRPRSRVSIGIVGRGPRWRRAR